MLNLSKLFNILKACNGEKTAVYRDNKMFSRMVVVTTKVKRFITAVRMKCALKSLNILYIFVE